MVQQAEALAAKPGGGGSMVNPCDMYGWRREMTPTSYHMTSTHRSWNTHIHTHTPCTHTKKYNQIWKENYWNNLGKPTESTLHQMSEHAEQFRDMRDSIQDEHLFPGRPVKTCYSCLRYCSHPPPNAVTATIAQTVAMTGLTLCTPQPMSHVKGFRSRTEASYWTSSRAHAARTLKGEVPFFVTSTGRGDQWLLSTTKINNLGKSPQRGDWMMENQKNRSTHAILQSCPQTQLLFFIPCVTCLTPTLFWKDKYCT